MLNRKLLLILLLFPAWHFVFGQVSNDSTLKLFQSLSARIEKIDPDDVENIPLYSIQIPELRKEMDSLCKYIQLNEFRPVQTESRKYNTYNELNDYFNHLSRVVEEKMSTIDLVLYEGALESLGNKDSLLAEQHLRQSIKFNPSYSPSQYKLLRLLVDQNRIGEAEEVFIKALKKIDTTGNIYYTSLWKRAAADVFSGYLRQADHYIITEDFLEAIRQTRLADEFQKKAIIPNSEDSIKTYYTFSHDGMFLGYLKIAQRAINSKKWDLANIYLKKASEYQKQNPEFISSGKLLAETYENLDKQYDHNYKSRDEQIKKIKYKKSSRYKKHHRRHSKPGRKSAKVKIKPVAELPKADSAIVVLDTAARDSIVERIRSAYFLAWKNQLDTARIVLENCKKAAIRFKIDKDTEYKNSIEELEKRILERHCFNVQSSYEIQVNKAISQFNRKNYPEAADALQKARTIYYDPNNCGLNDSLLRYLENTYQPVFAYEKMKDLRSALAVQNDYDRLYAVCIKLDSYVKSQKDQYLFKEHQNLAQFIEGQRDAKLTKSMINIAINSTYTDDCIILMEIYRKQNENKKSLTGEQKSAGKMYATFDYRHNPGKSAKEAFIAMNVDPKWFSYFKIEYLRTFKKLKKSKQ